LPMAVVQFDAAERYEPDGGLYHVRDAATGKWTLSRRLKKRNLRGLIHVAARKPDRLETTVTGFLANFGYGTYDAAGLWIDMEVLQTLRILDESFLKNGRAAEIEFAAVGGVWKTEKAGEIPSIEVPQYSLTEK